MPPGRFNSMIDPDFTNPKIVQLAMLNYEGQCVYHGLDGALWHGVYDQGATDYGVYLDTPGGPRRLACPPHVQGHSVPRLRAEYRRDQRLPKRSARREPGARCRRKQLLAKGVTSQLRANHPIVTEV